MIHEKLRSSAVNPEIPLLYGTPIFTTGHGRVELYLDPHSRPHRACYGIALPRSQALITSPYPGPQEPSLLTSFYLFKIDFNIIAQSTARSSNGIMNK